MKLKHLMYCSIISMMPIHYCYSAEHQSETKIVMLGTAVPAVNASRAGQGILVSVDKELFLFDAGPGALKNLAALKGAYFLPPVDSFTFNGETAYTKLNKLFITHLDSDHVLGLPEIMLRPWVLGRKQALEVVGPKGTTNMVNHILEAYKDDIDHRLNGSQPANAEGYKANVKEISGNGIVYQSDKVTIKAFKVKHGSWDSKMTFGYRIETPDKTIVLSGDTRKEDANLPHYKNADVLIHEVMSEEAVKKMPKNWQNYMYDAHTSTRQLAEIANQVKPKLLILNHVITSSDEIVNQEMQKYYKGEYKIASDLDVY